MRMQSEKPDIELMLGDDEVGDVVESLMPFNYREIAIHHSDGAVFMGLGHRSPNVNFLAHSSLRSSILDGHGWRDERLRVHGEVHHGGQGRGKQERRGWCSG
jgi:hypothetical protein